jgi:hypothetical protein
MTMKPILAAAFALTVLALPQPMVAETLAVLLPTLTYPEPVVEPTVTTSTRNCAATTAKAVCVLSE